MPTPVKGPRLGGSAKHHNSMIANLCTELFRHGRIKTTKSKAKKMQPTAERMITFARRGDLHARRQVLKVIRDKDVVHKLFADIGPAAADRPGGYTRVLPLGPRKGDNAEMALIELVDSIETEDGADALTEAPRRRWSLRRRGGSTLSRSAREREEAIAAAEDAGSDTYEVPDEAEAEESTEDDAIEAARITERALAASDSPDDDDDASAPDVTPEAVAARLGESEVETDDETDDDAEAADDAGDEEE